MYSKSMVFLTIFSLFTLLAITTHGRNGPTEYWKEIMKAQPIPESLNALLNSSPVETNDDFESRPIIFVYHDDTLKSDRNTHQDVPDSKKAFTDDFEPKPNIPLYND